MLTSRGYNLGGCSVRIHDSKETGKNQLLEKYKADATDQ